MKSTAPIEYSQTPTLVSSTLMQPSISPPTQSSGIRGPALFLAQFIRGEAPFNQLDSLAAWVAEKGFVGVQMPTNLPHIFDLEQAAQSQTYCDEVTGILAQHGLVISELSTHLQGQCLAVHPAYDALFDRFAPVHVQGHPSARTEWAQQQLILAARASQRLQLNASVTFSGALAWPYFYPWPQRPTGLIDLAYQELARRWRPILDHYAQHGVDLCFEIHPGEDLHDGLSFERFLDEVEHHERCHILYDPSHFVLQQLNYLDFIDIYHQRIRMFHVKDAEFNPTGRCGVYGGYANWLERAGRFRSVGDGQIDFAAIFSKLAQYDYRGWAVLEWECCLKDSETGAREGAQFIREHIVPRSQRAFDEFAASAQEDASLRQLLGI